MKHLFTPVFFLFLFSAAGLRAQDGPMRTSGETELLPGFTTEIQLLPDEVVIRMSGPADRWFAVGFNAIGMAPGTGVVFFADGSEGEEVYDGHLVGNQAPAEDESQDLTLLDISVDGDTRTVEVSRPLDTGDADDYTFDYNAETLQIIYAYGNDASTELAFHGQNRGSVILEFGEVLSAAARPDIAAGITLFPNPAREEIHLEFSEDAAPELIRIFDARARVVREVTAARSPERVTVSLAGLPAGVYFAEVQARGDRGVKKFVKE